MAVSPQFSALFLMIISTVVSGGSLFVNLTADREIVCPGDETVSYYCTVTSLQVQWIVEPFIPASGTNDVIISNVNSSVGLIVSRTGMIVEHVSINPLLTRLTINSSAISSSVNVTCSTRGLSLERTSTIQYIPDEVELPVTPAGGVNATPIMTDGSILVQFVRSTSPGITNYIVNCNDSTCKTTVIGGMEDDAIVEANSNSGNTHTVCVRAVNRCGRESQMSCSEEVEIPTVPATISLSVFYGVLAGMIVCIVLVIILAAVVIGYCYIMTKSQKRICNESAVGFNRKDGVDVQSEKF